MVDIETKRLVGTEIDLVCLSQLPGVPDGTISNRHSSLT